MLALTLSLSLLPQGPADTVANLVPPMPVGVAVAAGSVEGASERGRMNMKAWVDREGDPAHPDAVVVQGMPELTAEAAWNSVQSHLREGQTTRLVRFVEGTVERQSAGWLPDFVARKVRDRFLAREGGRNRYQILDRDLVVREHGFGRSYQGFLLVRSRPPSSRAQRGLLSDLKRSERRFLYGCGGVVGFWGLLALMGLWLDRLSLGYMTRRLVLVMVLLGLTAPGALLVL